jgi:photosystem II stability/assembly factor-like uncharacterized protein
MAPESVGFFDPSHGLIGTGWVGCQSLELISIPQCVAGAILSTSDGGRTTKVVLRTHGPVSSIAVVPGGRAWAFAFHCTASTPFCAGGSLLHSGNAGRTWQEVSRLPLFDVSFADPLHGLGVLLPNACDPDCSPFSLVARSEDGGRTWQRITTPCGRGGTSGQQVQAVSDVGAGRAWLLCISHAGILGKPPNLHYLSSKFIYRTDDGGTTWKLVLAVGSSTVNGLPRSGLSEGISFDPKGDGLLWEQLGSQYLTRDGGTHWQALEHVGREDGRNAEIVSGHVSLVLTPSRNNDTVRLVGANVAHPALTTVRVWRFF